MNEALRKKIIELFEYRELPKLIKYKNDKWDDDFYEKLIQLQYDIYLLDHELESNWKVDMDIISQRWEAIYKDLDALNVPRAKHDSYCKHIYKYQKHELGLRDQKLPTRLTMEYFYFYKSCDVKLLRKLIYDVNRPMAKAIKESDWRLFDLVTEINDDVEDLQEDLSTINGNRFLISLIQYGVEKTSSDFIQYLNELKARNKQFQVVGIEGVEIKSWTDEQIDLTIDMIRDQVKIFPILDVSKYDNVVSKKV